MSYEARLQHHVIGKSTSRNWDIARKEWDVVGYEEADRSICTCGKTGLKHCFRLKNRYNGNIIFPIGSDCVMKFGDDRMDEKVDAIMEIAQLATKVEKTKTIELTSDYFNKKTLKALLEAGAFPATTFNQGDEKKDYQFLLMCLPSKQYKTDLQKKKIWALLHRTILPFLEKFRKEHVRVMTRRW